MTDDIVTRLRGQMSNEFVIDHPNMVRVPTLYEQAADEIERLRTLLDNALEREYTNDARQLEIVRKVEADRDRWAKWGEHVFTCPNKGINPCRECVSPLTADAINRFDRGGRF